MVVSVTEGVFLQTQRSMSLLIVFSCELIILDFCTDQPQLMRYVCVLVCTAVRVIETISTFAIVFGVTSVDDEMFALLARDDNQVAVYSINDYRLLRHIHLPGLKTASVANMTSCVRHKCLYASDRNNRCIHRYDLSSRVSAMTKQITRKQISKWSVPGFPGGLSVTPGSCNLLVACWDYYVMPSKLVELRADSGQLVREITLQSDIEWLHHVVQLTTGQYVVCHGDWSTLNRMCMVDAEGRVSRSYGGQRGSGVGQLDWPRHLAVDEDSQSIFVADYYNGRVVLLSSRLEFVREFSEEVSDPNGLYFHQTTRRLFVGTRDGGVVVIQL